MPAPAPTRILTAEGAPRGGLAALCITQTTGWGVLYYALIAAARPISEDTGWDPALVTGAFSAGLLVSAAAGILVGRILDRTGPRTLMIDGSLVGVLALVMAAMAPNLPVFFAAWLVAGIAALTSAYGWRSGFIILAVIMGIITVPLHARYLNRSWAPAAPGTPAPDHGSLARAVRADTEQRQPLGRTAPQLAQSQPDRLTLPAIKERDFTWHTPTTHSTPSTTSARWTATTSSPSPA